MNSNTISQKLTFLELIKNYKIEIPIIQRDYAQGREDKYELRRNFLETLRSAIVEKKSLELDFVYGDVKEGVLRPLDGQQRLTTLFLLHWYIANKESNVSLSDKELLLKFTYETRASSREFCEGLVKGNIDFNNLLSTDYHDKDKTLAKNNQLSKTLENSSWYFTSWRRDPTIKAMLTMLDSIHQVFENESNLWSNLHNISFHFIELKGFGLSDDLYIKMNARGKPLTVFENFKAKFEQRIKQQNWETGLHVTATFAHKIDTVWADLFWRHKGEGFAVMDYEVINFIAGVVANKYALAGNEKQVQELVNNPISVKIEDIADKFTFKELVDIFNLYSNKENSFDGALINEVPLWDFTRERSLFTEFIKDANKGSEKPYSGPTYSQRVLFYAQTQFLLESPLIDDYFYDWIRVVRNIVENTTVDSPSTFIGAIKAINSLSAFQKDILNHLKNGDCDDIRFFSTQISEEKIKAQLILNNKSIDWKTVILKAENHNMFKGNIGFLFNNKEQSELETFLKWSEKANEFFDENGISSMFAENSLLLRSLISQFDDWKLFWNLNYDSTKENWSRILKNTLLIPYLQKLLDVGSYDSLYDMIKLDSMLEDRIQKLVHEDLFKSELLNAIEPRGYLRWEYDSYIIYPYNKRVAWSKYVIGSSRNGAISKALEGGIITLSDSNQQLRFLGNLLPYFWGWDVKFYYKGVEYVWRYDNKILATASEVESIELKELFSLS